MGMFSNAIQSLSQLAIQESGVNIPQTADDSLVDEIKARLNSMTPLTEEEIYVPAEAVTVKLSNRLNKYLIEAEEISHFMITNGLTNFKEAVGYILEANDLSGEYHNVAIVIDEDSILDEMDNLGYAVSDFNLQTPPKGLGLAMVGKQRDFAKLRNIANTKELMDLLTGRYGLPLVKRNYTSVGLLNRTVHHEAVEETEIKPPKDAKVLHEEDPKKKQQAVDEGFMDKMNSAKNFLKKNSGALKTGAKLGAAAFVGHQLYKNYNDPNVKPVSLNFSSPLNKLKGKFSGNKSGLPKGGREYTTVRHIDEKDLPDWVKNQQVKEEYELQEGYVEDAKEAGYKIKQKFQNATSSAADALRSKLNTAREVVNQATNDVKQKLNISSANEAMDPHEAHIQWMREVAAGIHNNED